jgi:hypothetical protein
MKLGDRMKSYGNDYCSGLDFTGITGTIQV